ncbi:serine/threonine protein kinase [Fusarium austroafricanum]|uniref:non-specific serine/threonine protein kinase n=1 Tax=Fusarium austroafricanum TaxID=2364996 RepID=A0A8H4JU69_9HYPO|nr:serine/threonine protein kinase [Fusarium austroafricanum]
MPEVNYPDYKLAPAVFQAWLRNKFNDGTIVVEADMESCREVVIQNPTALQKHLLQNRQDPHCCMIFLQSKDSRAPLNCSIESLSFLSSFFQIAPSFLDFISSFGLSIEPTDYHMTGFNGSDTLDLPTPKALQVPRLGRSGSEHVVQYLLRSVEQSTGPKDAPTWNIRQMAVHHKYDFITGKAFWLNLKTNSLMQERIKEVLAHDPAFSLTPADGLPRSFSVTLLTHLIHLEWCDESWRQCINDLEKEIRKVLKKAKTARVDQQPDYHSAAIKRAWTIKTNRTLTSQTAKNTNILSQAWLKVDRGVRKPLMSYLSPAPTSVLPVASEKAGVAGNKADEARAQQLKSLMVLDSFSFEEVQKLHYFGEQLESFRCTLGLNRQTLRDISEHYEDLANRENLPSEIKISCRNELASFCRRVERIRKNLEIRVTQVESLMAWLQEGKMLFDGILQYRSVQVSHLFTESSRIQSDKMEKIAYKTEKETISMHVITCVTLAFLPGTFVARHSAIMTLQLLEHFREYVGRHLIKGVNGEGQRVSYVPPTVLKHYWTDKRVNAVLNTYDPPIDQSHVVIINNHLHIWSILVYIGQPREITWFCSNIKGLDDLHLPLYKETFPPNLDSWVDQFLQEQWMFNPLNFTLDNIYKRVLPPKTILPLTYEKALTEKRGGQDAASLWKVQLHTQCSSVTSANEPVVFKIYEGPNAESLYTAESNVYSKLQAKDIKYITKQFACFSFPSIQKFIIVLEYAAGGSLLDFLQNVLPPVTPDETLMLWSRLLKLLDALEVLHDLYRPEGSSQWYLAGVHQDIQPANILVFPQKDKDSRFDVKFKLTDFGLAELGRVSTSGGTMATENRGNRMYISPEGYANFSVQELVKTNLPPTADIWALGAVFSDVLVWSVYGDIGRETYRKRRRDQISRQVHMKAADHDACFHDGVERLSSVQEFHNEALEHKRGNDALSPYMSGLILEYMLTDSSERLTAMQIRARAKREIAKLSEPSLATPQPQTPTNPSWGSPALNLPHWNRESLPNRAQGSFRRATVPASSRQRPTQRNVSAPLIQTQYGNEVMVSDQPFLEQSPVEGSPPPPVNRRQSPKPTANEQTNGGGKGSEPTEAPVTVDQVYPMLEAKDSFNLFNGTTSPKTVKGSDIMSLRGMQEARSKIGEFKGRDQIMVIDNYSSMKGHKFKVVKTSRVVSYVAKMADDDGMDLYAASEMAKKPRNCKTSSQIEKGAKGMKTVDGTCNMRRCLDSILDRILLGGKVKPTSIYVYTDGKWEPGEDQVKLVIKRAIDYLIKWGQPPSTIMFQFIQFGRLQVGTDRLQYLDDKCKVKHGDEVYDIVDTKHCDEHVPDIVIGSISRHVDAKGESHTVAESSQNGINGDKGR